MSGSDGTTAPVGSVDKALHLIELLAEAGPEGIALGALASSAGYTKTSAHRALQALRHRGFAEQDDEQRYRLGPRPSALVERYQREQNLPSLFRTALLRVCERTEELVHLGVLEGRSVLYLDKVEPERPMRVWSQIGRHAPVATTALGRAIMAAEGVGDDRLDAYLGSAAPDGLPRFRRAVAAARRLGWAIEREENEPGICCVGVALVRPQGPPVAVSVTGPTSRIDEERQARFGGLLVEELERSAPAGFTVVRP